MSNLVKPYEIAVYDDVLGTNGFEEKRLGIIGSDTMTGFNRALEPNLIRNVNGQNKFSFKMYKKYTDPITGEQVTNPFIDWLISERKIKLKYDGKWYDFIIKDINENSSNYLYTYQLEDANVQELSKNGFGVILDTELMNNIGTAKELGQYVMEETDWTVDGDVIVQTVEESLVYLTITSPITATHILDQVAANEEYPNGVTIDSTLVTFPAGTKILAFYSSCKNKPHRFQFIYSNDGYNKTKSGYAIDRNDKRVITEKDCQYYIDFNDPNTAYSVHNTTYNLYLPVNFNVVEMIGSETTDTTISTWYRGARYGYAQQAEYVPLLERYCQKFTKPKTFAINSTVIKSFDHEDAINGNLTFGGKSVIYQKREAYAGIYFDITYDNSEVYKLSYEVNNPSGAMYTLGGHAASFEISQFDVEGFNGTKWEQVAVIPYHTPTLGVYNVPEGKRGYQKYSVTAIYRKINKEGDGYPQIYIQPNIYTNESYEYEIDSISFGIDESYYGYTDTDYVSPTLVQNCITNYDFKKTSGWTPTQTTKVNSDTKPTVESFYGRYLINNEDNTKNEFRSIVDDYLKGTYSNLNKYTSYLKMEFKQANQFVLNSGIRDNRTTIDNMPVDEEWVLDYKIVNKDNIDISDNFTCRLAEFIYDKESDGYSERTGSMGIEELDVEEEVSKGGPYYRRIFKVVTNNYTKDQFKGKNGSKGTYLNLQIKPTNPTFSIDDNGDTIPLVYYIEHIALYRKVLDKNGNIIVPDYEAQESSAAQEYVNNSTLEHKYNYFNAWHVDDTNPKKIVDKEALPLYTTDTLKYDTYKPVYNIGAQKVRSVTVKESNYFNILQSIAETFEQWLVIDVQRNNTGAITSKKIKFKNYRGGNNYACFRYGVNLKDIQRTYSSKNIVTKLIVKQNTNELGKDGFCTIQRAGANPTGENYIYDFQYLQNTEIMKADEYLTTNYYMTGAKGPDGLLWKEKDSDGILKDVSMTTDSTYTLNGYFPRLKKINEAIIPLNQEIIGLNADLVKENAKKEVAEAEIEASLSGIEQTRLDFHALTGVYPEDAQDGTIGSVSNINVTAQDDWYTAVLDTSSGANSVKFVAGNKDVQVTPREILLTQGTEKVSISNGRYRVKSCGWDGLYVDYEYMHETTYLLTYDLEIITPETDAPVLSNIGCHNTSFQNGFKITVKGINNEINTDTDHDTPPQDDKLGNTACWLDQGKKSGKYHVSVTGKFDTDANEHSEPCLYIQPNRGNNTKIEYVVSNIKLYEVGTESGAASYDRTVAAYVSANVSISPSNGSDSYSITRIFEVKGSLPAGYTDVTLPINVTVVDLDRSDVKQYIEELTVYRQSNKNATETLATVEPVIAAKEQAIELKNQLRKQYLDWKKQLNYLFFKRYSQFIQEGTWINEEYVDDEKYYADAQSVLYNSCYPQVAYIINTLELSQLPGYELFKFDLGDKTWAIDDEFFGVGKHEEVIITELSEMLDDPSKNQIKVQNFKNQFQDLFQKITATVQQTQYNVGSYEKGDALLNASAEKKSQFITDAINNAKSYLSAGQTVESGPTGITITDDSNKKRQLRLVGGAILFSTEDPETKETRWRTGLTNEGISADLIKAGKINTGEIQIMTGDQAAFRWDAYGISAYDALWTDSGGISTVENVNTNKFVRFDKYGIYGIDGTVNGATWHPTGLADDYKDKENPALAEINDKATFALTWEGLKVTGNNGVVARLGKTNSGILEISRERIENLDDAQVITTDKLMTFSTDGMLTVGAWSVNQDGLASIDEDDSIIPAVYSPRASTSNTKIDNPKILLQPKGRRASFKTSATPEEYEEITNVVFKAGDHFLVTEDGAVYASAGKIGNVAIGDIENGLTGRNLALDSKGPFTLIPQQTDSEGKIYAVKHLELAKTLKANTTYMISFDIKEKDVAIDSYKIGLYYYTTEGSTRQEAAPTQMSTENETNGKKVHKITTYSTVPENSYKCILAIYAYKKEADIEISQGMIFEEIKLEEGKSATHWCPAEEDAMQANVTNNFSWKFSPTEGMFMWNGAQGAITVDNPTGGAVFAIYNDEGTHKLIVKGHVEAESGNIAGWNITEDTLTNYGGTKDTDGYYPNSFCMQIKTETNSAVNAMAIGKCSEETWGQAAFRVTTTGEMYASNGKIGSCSFYKEGYPVVGKDLDSLSFAKVNTEYNGLMQSRTLSYKVRYSPSDDYSMKTIKLYSSEYDAYIADNYSFTWYSAFSDNSSAPPTKYSDWTIREIDTSKIKTHPYLWFKCYVQTYTINDYGDYETEDIDTLIYYIGDFSGYLTTFSFGDDSLRIGENIITGKTSSIKFEDNLGRLSGTWYYGAGEIATSSWRGAKSNIEELDNRYSILFDKLQPVRFTYNKGQSHRYHTGFVLDELKDAMDEANIDTTELAAYCIADETTGEGGIRYGEFIALCVGQIQKLKSRVFTLEETIFNYEARIFSLEKEQKT